MFQSPRKLMQALLDVVDDMLVGAPDDIPADEVGTGDQAGAAPGVHPHRRPVRLRIERRPGMVAPRPTHCLSPVRPSAPAVPPAAPRHLAG
jgi:hypothetical protein